MKFKQVLSAVALGVAALAAHAAPTITNAQETVQYTGFDWASLGVAVTNGFAVANNRSFDLTYYAAATALLNTSGANYVPSGLDTEADGVLTAGKLFEYTIVANLKERTTTCASPGICNFELLSGSTFDIYYDETPDANQVTGTGFADGISIIRGTLTPTSNSGAFIAQNLTNGSGISALLGEVTAVNPLFTTLPVGAFTNIIATLQQGSFESTEFNPTGAFGGPLPSLPDVVLQADANQSFAVPEPSSLALVGLALAAGGVATRRRLKK